MVGWDPRGVRAGLLYPMEASKVTPPDLRIHDRDNTSSGPLKRSVSPVELLDGRESKKQVNPQVDCRQLGSLDGTIEFPDSSFVHGPDLVNQRERRRE